MKFSIFKITFILIILIFIISYYSKDSVWLTIADAGDKAVIGYYIGINGVYSKLGYLINTFPDYFDIIHLKRIKSSQGIIFSNGYWKILNDQTIDYISKVSSYVDSPPIDLNYWSTLDNDIGLLPLPKIDTVYGSLQYSPSSKSFIDESNLQILFNRPVNTCLLLIITFIFYLFSTNQCDKLAVTYSFHSVVERSEYWRIVTASLSHFDWLHVIFNAMTLYQIGDIEVLLGSSTYFYLSIDLIFLTMLTVILIEYILIHKFNRQDILNQQSVGYSCVLFAWIVVFSVRMSEFCPIFLFPSFCFKTYLIKTPLIQLTLPVNFGPIILLIFTKIIIPRSSFIGHLSGIIIGYPLAWGGLNWLTPSLLFSICLAAIIYLHKYYVWSLHCFKPSLVIASMDSVSFVTRTQLFWYRLQTACTSILSVIYLIAIAMLLIEWKLALLKLIMLFLCWSSIYAINCEWISEQSSVLRFCCDLNLTVMLSSILNFLLDLLNVINVILNYTMISSYLSSVKLYHISISIVISLGIVILLCEFLVTVSLWHQLNETNFSLSWLETLCLDSSSIQHDLNALGLKYFTSMASGITRWYNFRVSQGHRLSEVSQTNSSVNRIEMNEVRVNPSPSSQGNAGLGNSLSSILNINLSNKIKVPTDEPKDGEEMNLEGQGIGTAESADQLNIQASSITKNPIQYIDS